MPEYAPQRARPATPISAFLPFNPIAATEAAIGTAWLIKLEEKPFT